MNPIINVFRTEVPESQATRLLELREAALPELRRRCSGLLRAELVRLVRLGELAKVHGRVVDAAATERALRRAAPTLMGASG